MKYSTPVWKDLAAILNKRGTILDPHGRPRVRVVTPSEEEALELQGMFAGNVRKVERPRSIQWVWQLTRTQDVLLVLENSMYYLENPKADRAVYAVRRIKSTYPGRRLYRV